MTLHLIWSSIKDIFPSTGRMRVILWSSLTTSMQRTCATVLHWWLSDRVSKVVQQARNVPCTKKVAGLTPRVGQDLSVWRWLFLPHAWVGFLRALRFHRAETCSLVALNHRKVSVGLCMTGFYASTYQPCDRLVTGPKYTHLLPNGSWDRLLLSRPLKG